MTDKHLSALLEAAGAQKGDDGWSAPPDGRHFTFHVSSSGASLTVGRVRGVRTADGLLHARTVNGETYVLALEDVFAGAIDGEAKSGRKAGFV